MRSFFALVALVTAATAVYIRDDSGSVAASLTASNHFGAPNAPQVAGATPGWYFGDHPASANGAPWLKDPALCASLAAAPHAIQCPGFGTVRARATTPPTPTYALVFQNLTKAIEAPDYLTFGLVDTDTDCQAVCTSVTGCVFINAYHDVNGQNGSPLLTCALYSKTHNATQATNAGGQTQPDGKIDFITNSDGYNRTA
ncbi:hypothetical protein GYMLUDRAFT_49999 [Collybiopsis luxurians FD-317 M1]|uniref:Fruit-body specific protein a n=1 Tax=Collybiopsis luxurians FD-317 M1 TaxID=944289 RepID=A0A0D0APR8_9AGAR|nr:hypothetical protein GYMLUDRAFT_49999 [Collybiopsis luxurians FD-317 M1]